LNAPPEGGLQNNAELSRNPIWRHSIDASRTIDRANGPPYEGVALLVASCFFWRLSVRKSLTSLVSSEGTVERSRREWRAREDDITIFGAKYAIHSNMSCVLSRESMREN